MQSAPLPDNETERLQWLSELDILDTLEEQSYDDLTALAAQICRTPIALVSLVDKKRQWFKSHFGLAARETPREYAFCAHAILQKEPFVVPNADRDPRFRDNPLVTDEPHVKFYAGVPLVLAGTFPLGTLCIIDHQPRRFTARQRQALEALGRQVTAQLELRLKIKQLEQLDRAKDEFISLVSHELRTPLTAISGALTLLSSGSLAELQPAVQRMVDIAHRNGSRLLAIVNDMLDVAKMKAGRMSLQRKALDLGQVVRRAAELNGPYCAGFGCTIETRVPAQKVLVMGDEQRLSQVLANFMSNAAKFTQPGDTIAAALSTDGQHAKVEVIDHGPGVPPERQSELFKDFSQLSMSSNAKMPGTGLGLSICRRLIDLHGGEIGVESIPNVRTAFFFTLPIIG
jgi:signal transduction histidine kinase